MSITSLGIGTGLDLENIVQGLVSAEGASSKLRLSRLEARAQAQLSAVGRLRSSLESFRTALENLKDLDSFRGRTATPGDETAFTVSASVDAAPGTYAINITDLAERHKLTSGAYADTDTVGTGTLTITVNGESSAILLDTENNTLSGLRDAINDAEDNPGVVATIVNADDGSHLILTGTDTGADNAISITVDDASLNAFIYDPATTTYNLTEQTAATDAAFTIDGFTFTSSDNAIENAIDGVSIQLLAETESETELTVDYDRTGAEAAVTGFVEAYNSLQETVSALGAYDAEAKTRGILQGDSLLRSAQSALRLELSTATDVEDGFTLLSELGITTTTEGKLELDSAALSEAFDENFDAVGNIFAADDVGLAHRLDAVLEELLKSDGRLDARDERLHSELDRISDRNEALNARLAKVEERLRRQFTALDTLVSQLNSTSSFLANNLYVPTSS